MKQGVHFAPKEEYHSWFLGSDKVCVYCGMGNETAIETFGHRLHVDRKDGKLGYIIGNMCFACQRCNLVKSGYLTHEQMKEVAARYFVTATS